jgi:hypothetical protein
VEFVAGVDLGAYRNILKIIEYDVKTVNTRRNVNEKE